MIKMLTKSIREYKTPSILSPVMVTLEVILECIIPLLMAKLIDNMYGAEISDILGLGIGLIAMAFTSLVFGALSGKYCAKASAGFAKNLRSDLFNKIQGFAFSNIDKFSSSSLVTRLTTDISNVQNAYMMIIRIVVRSPLMLIFSLAMSFSLNVKISWIFLCAIPILGVGLFFIFRKAHPIFKRVFDKYDALNNSVQENVQAMRVVKSYVREDYETQKFDTAAEDIKNDFTKAEKIIALNTPLMQFAMYVVVLLIAAVGSFIIIDTFGGIKDGVYLWGELSTGDLASLIAYSMQILSSLMMMSMVLVMLSMSSASAKRIVEVLNEESSISNPANPITDVSNGDITFENVNFRYAENAAKPALFGINLHIKSGQTIGIIGGTGSGKTTLIQLISRLYNITEGTVCVGGINVDKYDLETLRDSVAVVLQKNVLFSGTIKENLKWGNKNATDEEIIEACKVSQAHDFVMALTDGYDTYIEQGGTNVSGGQKQRLCIARALLKNPKIIVLDDSTSAVDTKTDALIRKAFLSAIPDTTKIIIAQRTSSIQDSDNIYVMDGGTIVASGTHEELLKTSEIYQEVYYSQNKETVT